MFLSMAITFLITAIISGIFGFVMAGGTAAWIAKGFFFVSLVTVGVACLMTHGPPFRKDSR